MPQEIERKFLTNPALISPENSESRLTLMVGLARAGVTISQTSLIYQKYLKIEKDKEGEILEEERIRAAYPLGKRFMRGMYHHTIKRGHGETREEVEKRIRSRKYYRLSVNPGTVGQELRKLRTVTEIGNVTVEIDRYLGLSHPLSVCEIEFPHQGASTEFQPETLDWLLGQEVTNNPAYSNANLALSGRVPLQLI